MLAFRLLSQYVTNSCLTLEAQPWLLFPGLIHKQPLQEQQTPQFQRMESLRAMRNKMGFLGVRTPESRISKKNTIHATKAF